VSEAQQADSITVGARLRLRSATDAEWQYGKLAWVARDSIELTSDDYQRSRRFALRDVGPVEVYGWCRRRHDRRGPAAGAALASHQCR
jgi:hypothetical protein